ncbi:MAG: hypothetical protein K2L73_04655, partial [Muribaculaceae bacterium]|nr:hypothetical protein [Muribaculaceae bacterium]
MKRLFYCIVAMMAMCGAEQVSADVTLTGPVSVTFSSGSSKFSGGEVIHGNPQNVTAICNDGYIFNTVIVNGSVVYYYDTAERAETTYSWWDYNNDEPITSMEVTTRKLSDLQTGAISIKSPVSLWSINYNMSFSQAKYTNSVVQGTTEVKYIPEKDKLKITYSNYNNFYCITWNGNPINLWPEYPGSDILLDIADGDVIEVVATVPDKMCHVSMTSPQGETTFLTKAYYSVYNKTYYRWERHEVEDPSSFDVPAGSTLSWDWNYVEFERPETVLLNGTPIYPDLMSVYKYVIPVDRDNVTLSFPAVRWKEVDIQVDVDNASNVVLTAGILDNERQIIPLHDGLQTITILASQDLYFWPKGNAVIESVKVGDQEQEKSWDPYYQTIDGTTLSNLKAGTEKGIVTVTTAMRERTLPVHVYVKDCNGTAKLWAANYIEPYYFDIADGENSLMMCADDLKKLYVSFNQDETSQEGTVESTLSTYYQGFNLYQLVNNLNKDYAVISIFGADDRQYHPVTVESDFDESKYQLFHNYSYALTGTSHSIPEGNVIHINMLDGATSDVYVNDKKLATAGSSSHVFTVTEPTTVQI